MISEDTKYTHLNASRFTWSAIIGGIVITLAMFMMFMMLGLSLGLAVMDFRDGISLKASGWFSSLWTLLSFVVSLGLGTYSSSLLSGSTTHLSRILNGLTVWAVVSLMMMYGLGKGSTQIVAKTGKAVSNQLENLSESIPADVLGQSQLPNINFDSLKKAYNNIEAPELKKSLEEEINILSQKAQNALKETLVQPDKLKQNINELKLSAKDSVTHLESEYDRDEIAAIISKNTELSEVEAQKAAEEWQMTLQKLSHEMEDVINKAEVEVIEMANSTKNAAAFSSFFMFMVLVLGFLASLVSSNLAVKHTHR